MCPVPFFFVGCCISQTTKMQFNNTERKLSITTYSGHLCCSAETEEIAYDDVLGVYSKRDPNCYVNRQPAFVVYLKTRRCQIKLSGYRIENDAKTIQNYVQLTINRCGAHHQQVNQGGMRGNPYEMNQNAYPAIGQGQIYGQAIPTRPMN